MKLKPAPMLCVSLAALCASCVHSGQPVPQAVIDLPPRRICALPQGRSITLGRLLCRFTEAQAWAFTLLHRQAGSQ
ncbi:MAG: hypothetical protein EOP86_23215 [Verrucomicrobiaceae bacterium]|nr:MAG: hypothetical protein EOP86_23215 [Verrucomicrobiaceae bacterium]